MKHIQEDEVINIACAVGYNNGFFEVDDLLQFVKEIQAHTLVNFATWVREKGDRQEMVGWTGVAINAELEAVSLGAYTV